MNRHGSGHLRATLLCAALAGCASGPPARLPPPEAVYETARPAGLSGVRVWADESDPAAREEARRRFRDLVRAKRDGGSGAVAMNFLALSGGGPDGAFAAGLLAGWTESGDRPEFDIVTGISVGALIAPFAYLGPDYDDTLGTIFTELGREDVLIVRPFAALFGALGLADTTPLRRTIRALIDDAVVARIAEESRSGRALLIGTTHIDAQRPVIWDMGAIARAGDSALFADVLLASASIPGVFPPVAIEVRAAGARFAEYHVDGGVEHSVMLWPSGYDQALRAVFDFPVDQTIYVIQNNPLVTPYDPVEPSLPAIASRALSALIRSQSQGDLVSIHRAAEQTGSDFRLIFVPPQFQAPSATEFDPAYMRRLYAAAFEMGLSGVDWLTTPPRLLDRDALDAALAAQAEAALPP